MQITGDDGGQEDQQEGQRGMKKGGWGEGSAITEPYGNATMELLYDNLKLIQKDTESSLKVTPRCQGIVHMYSS